MGATALPGDAFRVEVELAPKAAAAQPTAVQRHHDPPMPLALADIPAIAAQLGDDTLHVWQLRYERSHGRAPLLALLAGYLGVPADTVRLGTGPHGRPQLGPAQACSLDFNWSHSGDRALVALGRGVAPGIDIERRRARPRALALASRYFDPAEAAWLATQPPELRDEAFLALWTAKEAVLKALGRGLAFGLDRLHVEVAAGAPRLRRLEGERIDAWQLQALDAGPAYRGALAWRGPPRPVRQWILADAA